MSSSSMSSSSRRANRLLCRVAGRVTAHTLEQDLSIQFLATNDSFHGVFSRASRSWAGVSCQYTLLYLSTLVGGMAKETVRWLVLGGLTTMAMLFALTWLERVWCAIGCVPMVGVTALITLGGGAHTFGAGAGVCMYTLGFDAGVGVGSGVCTHTLGVDAGVGDSWMFGGLPVGKLKMAWRLSTASSWE